MHEQDGHGTHSGQAASQAQADACCAASEHQHPDRSAPSSIAAIASAVLGTGVVLRLPVPSLVASDSWRTVAPAPIAAVARHVLLSVFLV
jgi:hypothetical protein